MPNRTLLFIIGDFTVTHAFKLSKKVCTSKLKHRKKIKTRQKCEKYIEI